MLFKKNWLKLIGISIAATIAIMTSSSQVLAQPRPHPPGFGHPLLDQPRPHPPRVGFGYDHLPPRESVRCFRRYHHLICMRCHSNPFSGHVHCRRIHVHQNYPNYVRPDFF